MIAHPRDDLRVHVTDAAGAAVEGVPVSLFMEWSGGTETSMQLYRTVFSRARSNREGMAVFERVDEMRGYWFESRRISVGLDIQLAEPVERLLPSAVPPADMIEFVLPPTGEVRFQFPAGVGRTARALLAVVAEGSPTEIHLSDMPRGERVVGNEVVFPHVGLGLRLELTADCAGLAQELRVEFDGPVIVHELLRVARRAEFQAVVGRLVDARGEHLGGKTLSISEHVDTDPSKWTHQLSLETDEAGRFMYLLQKPSAPGAGRRLTLTEQGVLGCVRGKLVIDLPEASSLAETDLGDLTWVETPLIAMGRVVTWKGEPIQRAKILLEAQEIASGESPGAWQPVRGLPEVETDAKGLFELRGETEQSALRVSALHAPYDRMRPVPVTRGTSDAVLTLYRGGCLAGSSRLSPSASMDDIFIRLHVSPGKTVAEQAERGDREVQDAPASAEAPSVSHYVRKETDGSFSATRLPAGIGRLSFTSDYRQGPFLTIEGIEIEPGEATRDARLEDIDLRELFRPARVKIVDAGGRPIPAANAWHVGRAASGTWEDRLAMGESGVLDLRLQGYPMDLVIEAEGYRRARVYGVRDDIEVVLRPGLRVRVKLDPETELQESPYDLLLTPILAFESADGHWGQALRSAEVLWRNHFGARRAGFDGKRELRFTLPEAGAWRLHWTLAKRANPGNTLYYDLPWPVPVIEVADVQAEQTFEVYLPEGNIQKAMKRLER